jgi:hypothetical protein
MGPASVATQRQADGNGPLPPGFPVPQWGVGDHVLPARGAPSDPPARTVRPQIPSSLSRSIIPPPRFLPILSYSPHLPFLLSGPSLVYLRSRKFLCFRRRAVTGVYERTPCVGFASNQPLPLPIPDDTLPCPYFTILFLFSSIPFSATLLSRFEAFCARGFGVSQGCST